MAYEVGSELLFLPEAWARSWPKRLVMIEIGGRPTVWNMMNAYSHSRKAKYLPGFQLEAKPLPNWVIVPLRSTSSIGTLLS